MAPHSRQVLGYRADNHPTRHTGCLRQDTRPDRQRQCDVRVQIDTVPECSQLSAVPDNSVNVTVYNIDTTRRRVSFPDESRGLAGRTRFLLI